LRALSRALAIKLAYYCLTLTWLTGLLGCTWTIGLQGQALAHPKGARDGDKVKVGDKVTVVCQKNLYMGPSKLYLGDDRAKLVTHDGTVALLCTPPDWMVVIYRTDQKLQTQMPIKTWAIRGFGLMPPQQSMTGGATSTTMDEKLKVICTTTNVPINRPYYEGNDPMMFRSTARATVKNLIQKTTDAITVSDNIRSFIKGIYNQQSIQGIPLELTNVASDGRISTIYNTVAIGDEIVQPNFWDRPNNYKQVPRICDVFASQKDLNTYGNLIKSIMVDKTKPEPKAKQSKND